MVLVLVVVKVVFEDALFDNDNDVDDDEDEAAWAVAKCVGIGCESSPRGGIVIVFFLLKTVGRYFRI